MAGGAAWLIPAMLAAKASKNVAVRRMEKTS
jgi:hypothetical protein